MLALSPSDHADGKRKKIKKQSKGRKIEPGLTLEIREPAPAQSMDCNSRQVSAQHPRPLSHHTLTQLAEEEHTHRPPGRPLGLLLGRLQPALCGQAMSTGTRSAPHPRHHHSQSP